MKTARVAGRSHALLARVRRRGTVAAAIGVLLACLGALCVASAASVRISAQAAAVLRS